jgi:hypothetical protein
MIIFCGVTSAGDALVNVFCGVTSAGDAPVNALQAREIIKRPISRATSRWFSGGRDIGLLLVQRQARCK